MNRIKISKLILCAILLAGLGLSIVAPRIPEVIEPVYSQSLYRWFIRPFSLLTGLFPFSVAEVIVVSTFLYLSYKFALAVKLLIKSPRSLLRACQRAIPKIALMFVIVFVTFNLMWGLNYSRLPFSETYGIKLEPSSVDDLTSLALALTYRANDLRRLLDQDANGLMVLSRGNKEMFSRADLGYHQAADLYPALRGSYGKPKGVFLSPYWSYTGIGGVYFPFTAEANVNTNSPQFVLPFAATHEMAHQRGFAREDEANYIGYLTCVMHPDSDFQYSGVALALMNTMNALRQHDVEAWADVRRQYNQGLDRDFLAWDEYLERYDGKVQRISNNINDSYLKANRQQDGVQSYGRMIDLLMAEFRADQEFSD